MGTGAQKSAPSTTETDFLTVGTGTRIWQFLCPRGQIWAVITEGRWIRSCQDVSVRPAVADRATDKPGSRSGLLQRPMSCDLLASGPAGVRRFQGVKKLRI